MKTETFADAQTVAEEAARLQTFLLERKQSFVADAQAAQQLAGGANSSGDVAQRAAWVALASVLLNLEETITRE